METEVGVEGNEEGKFVESKVAKTGFFLSPPKQIANPIVYKLVRLEGDGRLVPATDDEVIEVEGLLVHDKNEMQIITDTGQTMSCISNEGFCGILQLESSEGLSQSENMEVDPCKSESRFEETVPPLAPSLDESQRIPSNSVQECLNPPDKDVLLTSATIATSKPDFSKLKGEICLDNLSIKELHETFKAAFGRETTVKDKQWLKRRITLGLTNSCDVSATTFIIKNNKLVRSGKGESCNNLDGGIVKDLENGSQEKPGLNNGSQQVDHLVVPDERLGNNSMDGNCDSEDHQIEQRAAKRVRKPTKRYIEEFSEVESKGSSVKLTTTTKNSGFVQVSPKSHVKLVRNVYSDGRIVFTRLDSLGGSGIQIPCVNRVRRSRPRKNFTALLKFNPSGMSMATTLVKKALGTYRLPTDREGGDNLGKARCVSEQVQHQLVEVPVKDKQFPDMGAIGLVHGTELKPVDTSGDLNVEVVTVRTSKGGIRRKHHRAWTLSEVVKLVEGVSTYGAGRWSEIKRLAFASYSYRTSVDLKDKWRNLLKASFAQTPPDKEVIARKNAAATPIPAPILLRVRELAHMQSQVPPKLGSTKVAGITGKTVHEKQSGYL